MTPHADQPSPRVPLSVSGGGPRDRSGRIPQADRIQRLLIGSVLMLLTIRGLGRQTDWRVIAALILQADLLITGIAGWCPVYWACQRATVTGHGFSDLPD